MASVADLLHHKDVSGTAQLVTVAATATVLEATKLMNSSRVGSVLVRAAGGGIAGILTERDVLTRIVAAERDPKTTRVSEVMTSTVASCKSSTSLDELRTMFHERR